MSLAPEDAALAHIRGDMDRTLRRRRAGLSLLLLGAGLLFFALALMGPGAAGLSRDLSWSASMVLLFLAASGSATVVVGYPVWRPRAALGVTIASTLAATAAVLVAVDSSAAAAALSHGPPCLVAGTLYSFGAFTAAAMLTGRLWRRFVDLSWVSAVGASTIGLAVQHNRCPAHDAAHLLGFHLTAALVLFLATRLLVPAVLSAREAPSAEPSR